VLLSTLGRHAESQNVALLRGLLGCLSVLLRLQPPALWTQLPEVGRTFQSLLAYTAHTKPKLRKVNIQIIYIHLHFFTFTLGDCAVFNVQFCYFIVFCLVIPEMLQEIERVIVVFFVVRSSCFKTNLILLSLGIPGYFRCNQGVTRSVIYLS
jgi:hypothetical protein